MTPAIVVDASVLVKRVLAEPDSGAVRAWFNANEGARFVGPSLLLSETGRILQKNLPNAAVAELRLLHSRLLGGMTLIEPHEAIWDAAESLSFCDAHYVHLASEMGATLATTDEHMEKAARSRDIPLARF